MTKEKFIVCAAIKDSNGIIITGARHFDHIMVNTIENLKRFDVSKITQGFIDQFGEFHTRKVALEIATKSLQINTRRPKTAPIDELFSEDLY